VLEDTSGLLVAANILLALSSASDLYLGAQLRRMYRRIVTDE
jgi:hypothetical protein